MKDALENVKLLDLIATLAIISGWVITICWGFFLTSDFYNPLPIILCIIIILYLSKKMVTTWIEFIGAISYIFILYFRNVPSIKQNETAIFILLIAIETTLAVTDMLHIRHHLREKKQKEKESEDNGYINS